MRLTLTPSLLAIAALSLGGCTYVTNSDWVEKTDCLDEDGDGAVRNGTCTLAGVVEDCDDDNAARAPDIEEVPYDGIDNNCDTFDLVDIDQDGFPGISLDDWVVNDGSALYPSGLSPLVDCDDNSASINPGRGEVYYDGVDSNCDGADDWDADGDGYVPLPTLLPAGALPYTGTLPGGDCDDTDAAINPGIETDVLFDGLDSNCDMSNDFDGDGDGWMLPLYDDSGNGAFTAYVGRFGYEGLIPRNFGDCDDDDGTIYPGANDPFYDGINSNCDDADDFDQDLDGVILSMDLWPDPAAIYSGSLPEGDCDDTDPDVIPGKLEILGDTVDQDCDGGADTTALRFHPFYEYTNPRPPVVGLIDNAYVLLVASDQFRSTLNTGSMLSFLWQPEVTSGTLLPPGPDVASENAVRWEPSAPGAFGGQIDAVFDGDRLFIGASQLRPNTSLPPSSGNNIRNQVRMYMIRQTGSGLASTALASAFGDTAIPYTGLDIEMDAQGDLLLGACNDSVAHFKYATPATTNLVLDLDVDGTFDSGTTPTSVGGSCFISERAPENGRADGVLHAFGDIQTNFQIDSGTDSDIISAGSSPILSSFTVNSVVQRDGLTALSGTSPGGTTPAGLTLIEGGAIIGSYLLVEEVSWASAARLGSDVYIAAVVADRDADGKRDVVLLYGSEANPTELTLPALTTDGTAIDADGVSLWVDSDRVFIGVTGSAGADDVVGWAFFAP